MKILLISYGGREHALAWKLKKDGAKEIVAASYPKNLKKQLGSLLEPAL